MSRTSGQRRVQTTLKTFQDLDLCSKTVIMDVVGYIGKQQSRRKQALWSSSDLIWWYQGLAFPQNVQFLFCTRFFFCFIMTSWVDLTDPTLYIQSGCLVHLIKSRLLDKHYSILSKWCMHSTLSWQVPLHSYISILIVVSPSEVTAEIQSLMLVFCLVHNKSYHNAPV